MNAAFEVPPFLKPQEGFEGIGAFRLLGIYQVVDAFAREFRIDHEIAMASFLAGAAHSLGGAIGTDTTLGVIRPPFSLLLVTPEHEPVWPRIAVRFLTDDFEQTIRIFAGLNETTEKRKGADSTGANEPGKGDGIEKVAAVAKQVYAERISERIASCSLTPPFPRLPFDHHVMLTTPPAGLRRGFRQLSPEQRIRLENVLSTNQPLPTAAGEQPGAAPSFYWQIARDDAPKFLEENPWFAGVPFLILESEQPGNPLLEPHGGSIGDIGRLCLDLFVQRHQAMGRSRLIPADSKVFRPIHGFLNSAQKWQAHGSEGIRINAKRVTELAFQFSLLFMVLDGKSEPDMVAVNCGLELAKRLTIRHHRTLSTLLPVEPKHLPDTADLSQRERAVFLRICERPGLSPSALSRSFNKLPKAERDEIIVTLVDRNLIKLEDGKLWQIAA